MKFTSSALAYAALAARVSAFPQFGSTELDKRQTDDDHEWRAPGDGAVRAPCPGMNTLANHGYISRDGKNIRAEDVSQGFLDAFGFDPAITTPGSNNAISLCSSQTGSQCDTFNLDMLSQPHQMEHDGSMTRLDAEMADNMNANNHDFNQGIFQMTLDIIGDQDHINATTAETVRLRRFEQAMKADAPGWFVRNDGGSLAEHGFTLVCMNDQPRENAAANLDWVKYWWSKERLPTAIGWKKPSPTIDQAFFNRMVNSISAATTYAASTSMASSSMMSSSAPVSSSSMPSSASSAASSAASSDMSSAASSGMSSAASSGMSSAASSGMSSGASSGMSSGLSSMSGSSASAPGGYGGGSMSSGSASASSAKISSMSTPAGPTTPSMTASIPTSSAKAALSSVTKSEKPSIVSSAAAKATSNTGNGGNRPALNGYQEEHPPSEWKNVAQQCHKAVVIVQIEIVKLLKGGYAGATAALGGTGSGSGSSGSGSSGSGSSGSGSGSGSGSDSGSSSGGYQAPPPAAPGAPGKKTKTVVVTATTTVSGDCTCPTY